IMIWQNGFCPPLLHDCFEAVSNLGNRFVPRNAHKLPGAFLTNTSHGVKQSVLVVHPTREMGDLVTEKPVRRWVIMCATNLFNRAVRYCDFESARVRTIHCASGVDGLGRHLLGS